MSHKIRLNAADEVNEFVNAASKCDFDIDIFSNRIIIDVKSILGVLSMDLSRELTVLAMAKIKNLIRLLRNLQ